MYLNSLNSDYEILVIKIYGFSIYWIYIFCEKSVIFYSWLKKQIGFKSALKFYTLKGFSKLLINLNLHYKSAFFYLIQENKLQID